MLRTNFCRRHDCVCRSLAGFAITVAIIMVFARPENAKSAEPDHVSLGAGLIATPAYQGSSDYRVLPIPVIDIKEGWFFANLRNGIGVTPVNTDHITAGVSAVFVQGYRHRDVLEGIDKLGDGVGARIFANIRLRGLIATIGATKGVSGGTKGVIADVSVTYPISLSPEFTLSPSVGTSWANAKHNNRYFGVTEAESAVTGLPMALPGAGFKDASASLTASYRLNERISLSVTGIVTTLLSSVKDSPQVEKKAQPTGLATISYRF